MQVGTLSAYKPQSGDCLYHNTRIIDYLYCGRINI